MPRRLDGHDCQGFGDYPPLMVSAGPALVKYQFALTSTTLLLVVNDHFCWIFRQARSAQQAEIARFGQTSIGSPEHSVRSAGGCTTPTHGPPRVPFLQRRITGPISDQTSITQQPLAPGTILRCHPLTRMH